MQVFQKLNILMAQYRWLKAVKGQIRAIQGFDGRILSFYADQLMFHHFFHKFCLDNVVVNVISIYFLFLEYECLFLILGPTTYFSYFMFSIYFYHFISKGGFQWGFVSGVVQLLFDLFLKVLHRNSHELKLYKRLVYCRIEHVTDYFHSKVLLC